MNQPSIPWRCLVAAVRLPAFVVLLALITGVYVPLEVGFCVLHPAIKILFAPLALVWFALKNRPDELRDYFRFSGPNTRVIAGFYGDAARWWTGYRPPPSHDD
jgi:hypothetical protein